MKSADDRKHFYHQYMQCNDKWTNILPVGFLEEGGSDCFSLLLVF